MILPAALIAAAILQADGPRLAPVFYLSTSLIAQNGEPIRLGSSITPVDQLAGLVRAGVSIFEAETDRLGPPITSEGPYSWDGFDLQRAAVRAAGADWILSVFTTFPEANNPTLQEGTANALTGEKVPAWSIWNPERLRWSANRFGAINRRFAKLPMVTIGVSGEYGDAGFFTGLAKTSKAESERWQKRFSSPPPSYGPWAGELVASDSWRRRVETSYGSIDSAYRSWGMEPPADSRLGLPVASTFTYSARLTWMDWYRGSLSSLASSLSDIADNVFKESLVLVPVGPSDDRPYLGVDLFRIAESVKGHADALKATSIGFYDFAANWAMTLAKLRGAAKANDIPLWSEAASAKPEEFDERLFEAVSLGSRGHIDSPASIRQSDSLPGLTPDLTAAEPEIEVAVLHPTSSQLLNPNQPAPPLTFRGSAELRDYVDFDMLEESAVIEGALRNYRVAIVFEGAVWDPRSLSAIKGWVEQGGILLAYDFGKMADAVGNTATYQSLFGFASDLKPATVSDHWVGDTAGAYRVDIGASGDAEFLLGPWSAADAGSRNASNGATLRLPFAGTEGAVVTLTLGASTQPIKNVQMTSAGRLIAGVGLEGGLKQISITVDKAFVKDGIITLQIAGLDPGIPLPVDALTVAEPEGEPSAKPLSGRFEADVAIDAIKGWTHKLGKGLTIFYPAKRDQWKGYISVIRSVLFHTNEIDSSREPLPERDNVGDGLFVTDLGDRLAIYNSTDLPLKRAVRFGGSKELTVQPHKLNFLHAGPPPFTGVTLCKTFATEAVPVEGEMVRVGGGIEFSTTVTAPSAGHYRLFARTLRNGALVPVHFNVAGADALPAESLANLDAYFVGEFDLQQGDNKVTMKSDGPFLAHLLVATDMPRVRGYRILEK